MSDRPRGKPPAEKPDVSQAALDATIDGSLPRASEALAHTMASDPDGVKDVNVQSSVSVNDSLRGLATWDRYEILGLLGRGGMGAVYKARDRRLGRVVALKFIRGDDENMTRRFVQEARAQSRIEHPFVCKVHEVGEVEGRPYIAMQLVEGSSLDRAAKAMSLRQKVQLIHDVALALHSAHELGIIHRDIKPSNIMVEKTDGETLRPVVMDFGLAREAGEGKGLTESGAVLGTPAYMSPEQARGDVRNLDRRTDVYSLGATLYDVLTGTPPFDDEAVVRILIQVINDTPPPLRSRDPKLPEALELITSKCLNKEAKQRYDTALALAQDLERFLGQGRVSARRLSYSYRIRYFARRNKALSVLAVALSLSLVGGLSFGVYTRIVNARKAALLRKQAELSRELGQEIKDLEWLMRAAHGMPLHDIGREKAQVRQRMAQLAVRFAEGGEATEGLVSYGRGRGHLALHEYAAAEKELRRAESLHTSLPELHYALGRVQGELYTRALEDARRSGDATFFEKRRKELEKEYLEPALAHLAAVKASGARVESPHYLEGLIAFYTKQLDAALTHADAALAQDGWLYEARKLAGDVYLSRALDEKDSGKLDASEKDFQEAVTRYEQAADIGRSDHEIYESIAESWIRQMELDIDRGRDPTAQKEKALAAADKSVRAASQDTYGYTKQAFAYYFMARYKLTKDETQNQNDSDRLIEAGLRAIAVHPDDAYAHEIIGVGYFQKSQKDEFETAKKDLSEARKYILNALRIDPKFAWAYNDLALTYLIEYYFDMQHAEGNIASLRDAREYLSKAIKIDNRYFIAYANLAETNRLFSQWLTEHGQDPREYVSQAAESAKISIKINENNPNAYGIIGQSYVWQAVHGLDREIDIQTDIDQAIEYFKKLISINAQNTGGLADGAYAYFLKAKGAPLLRATALQEGLKLATQCRKLASTFAPCLWTEALLRAQAEPAQALTLARQAVKGAMPEQAAEANYRLAMILDEQASRADSAAALFRAYLDESLDAVTLALKQNQGWPRALALQGKVAWLLAKQERKPARRAELLRLSEKSMERGLAGNPLLEKKYQGVWRELAAARSKK